MILIDDIWYNETLNEDLIEIARIYNEEFSKALEERFKYYESIEHYED